MSSDNLTVNNMVIDSAMVRAVKTNHYGIFSKIKDIEAFSETKEFNAHHFRRNYELQSTIVKVQYLKQMVELLEKGGYEQVRLETGKNLPITFTASTGKGESFFSILAPRYMSEYYSKKLKQAEKELLGFQTCCKKCDWKNRYNSKTEAIDAGEEHKYFEGHGYKVFNSQIEEVASK